MAGSSSRELDRLGAGARTQEWLNERLGFDSILIALRKKTVPVHAHSHWYYWGGLSLFFFVVQLFTGILLLVYYRPGPEAHDSVRRITYDIDFGWLIRSAHSWSANLMVVAVFVHMFAVFFMKAYRQPRELGWWSGLALLGFTLIFGFSGYLLPMDELAYFATKVALEIPASLPLAGAVATDLLRAGPEVTELTTQRFFALHAVVLPLLFFPVAAFHLWLVQKHGNALPPSEQAVPVEVRRSIPFFPNFLTKELAMWLMALNALAILGSLFPWQLGSAADPLTPAPLGIHPEWYFMNQFQLLKLFGRWFPAAAGEALGMTLFTFGAVLWVLVPLFDSDRDHSWRPRLTTAFGLFAIGLLVGLTIWGYADL